jgi:hypothetical protein
MQRTIGNRATGQFVQRLISQNSPSAAIQRNVPEPDQVKDKAEVGAGITGAFSDSFGKKSDDLKDAFAKDKNQNTAQDSASYGAVSSTADLIGGPFQILSAIRDIKSVSDDTNRTGHNKRWNHATSGTSTVESSGKMISGSVGLVDKSAKSVGHKDGVGHSSVVSDYTGTVAEAISAVKNVIATVKSIYDMYSKHDENGGMSKGEVAKGVLETISNMVQSAQSGLKVAKGIMEIMQSSTDSLTAVIPGVSIAVSGVKIAIKTVDMITAGINRAKMTKLKREFKEKYANEAFVKAKTTFRNAGVDKEELSRYKGTLANRLTLAVQSKDGAKAEVKAIKLKIEAIDQEITLGTTESDTLKRRKARLEGKLENARMTRRAGRREGDDQKKLDANAEVQSMKEKLQQINSRIALRTTKDEQLRDRKTRQEGKLQAARMQRTNSRTEIADLTGQQNDISDYELAKEMKNINVKRTTRGGLQIGIELTKIAGDIATLTGVGAQVGTPLKIVAAGVGASMPLVRSLKQAGRDRAAKAGAWGITKAVFNADKSSANKSAKRSNHADLMIDMIDKLPQLTNDPAVLKRYEQMQSLVEAAGVSLYALEQFKTDPVLLKEKLVDAMMKRE